MIQKQMLQKKKNVLSASILLAIGCVYGLPAMGQTTDGSEVELETYTAEGQVEDSLGMMPTEAVESVFGFGKTIVETPRAVSSISANMIDAFNITDIDDLVVVSPGAFTQSFFGVAGSLDVRGTAGEVYFRGMRRLDNPGNYPTPLGASDRIDIVRGPATPIMGPAKIGGYLNFIPKSARAETGQYLEEPTGEISLTRGSWDKNVMSAEVGGPAEIAGKELGYYIFVETENSGSYYENSATDQNVYQASFNMDLTNNVRIEFGGMYHEFDGNQIAGWNRLTQDLIDNGTYITGSATPLDLDGDGLISHEEYGIGFSDATDDAYSENFALVDVGTGTLEHYNVLVAPEDVLQNEALTLYFDVIVDDIAGFQVENKLFYDGYQNLNENAYGFSQEHDSFVIEERLVLSKQIETSMMDIGLQISPSIRHTDFEHGDDFFDEYFDRRDLTGPSTALDKRLLATQTGTDYSEYYVGTYTDYGFGVMADVGFDNGLSVLLGARYDYIDMYSRTPIELVGGTGDDPEASDEIDGLSWTFSLSWDTPIGLTPYVTASSQVTMIAGQGADLTVDNVAEGTAVDDSTLQEIGVKGSFLDDRLFVAVAHYEQERTDFSAQSSTTNESVKTTGTEFELRYLVNDALTLTAAVTDIEVVNINTLENGGRFTFLGAEDLPDEEPGAFYGGAVAGFVSGPAEKAGIPETSYSLTAHYTFLEKYALTASYFHADEVASGYTAVVTLPSYDLFNLGVSYKGDKWDAALNFKNITNEKYYRSNFPNLFGSSVVLPEKPFSWEANVAYHF